MELTDEQIERWMQYRDAMFADTEFMDVYRKNEHEREPNISDAQNMLRSYLGKRNNNSEFRGDFQLKTMNAWRTFGLSGFSGAMFLNMLVNNVPVPDQAEVEQQLKTVLPVPESLDDAYDRLSNFMDFLKRLVNGKVSKRKLQPAHAPFFVSAWWHFQDMQEWPIYYVSGRKTFNTDGLYEPSSEKPVDDYFAFRDVFIALRERLQLKPWEMEHLGVWYQERREAKSQPISPPVASVVDLVDEGEKDANERDTVSHNQHSLVQLILAQIGKSLGCKIWIAKNDRNRLVNGERLGDYSLDELPAYIVPDPEARKLIELIDVLWLQGSRGVAAAFEVEHTTSIYSGLLRMSDLKTLQPNLIFPIYIVTSTERIHQVRQQLSRPTFQVLQLHENCGFFSFEELMREKDSIIRWAKSPEAIDKLAKYVPTILTQ
jgi:hypothetical protein